MWLCDEIIVCFCMCSVCVCVRKSVLVVTLKGGNYMNVCTNVSLKKLITDVCVSVLACKCV